MPCASSEKAMSQPPCFDIEYWRSYGPFHLSGAKWKYLHRIAVTFLIFNIIIFPLNIFQPYPPPVILTTRMLDSIILSLRTLWMKFHHRRRHFFVNSFFKYLGSNVVSNVYSWIYQFFSFFSCGTIAMCELLEDCSNPCPCIFQAWVTAFSLCNF